MYIDSHAHFDLTLEDGSITEDILMDQTRAGGIDRAVQISIDTASSRWSRGFAKRHAEKGILFTVGIHPSSPADDIELNDLSSLAEEIMSSDDSKLLFGIGECGLDFYRKRQPAEIQERSFRYQIELANRLGLPVIVHSREAMEQTLAILARILQNGRDHALLSRRPERRAKGAGSGLLPLLRRAMSRTGMPPTFMTRPHMCPWTGSSWKPTRPF